MLFAFGGVVKLLGIMPHSIWIFVRYNWCVGCDMFG